MKSPQPETHRIRIKLGDAFIFDYQPRDRAEAEALWARHSAAFDRLTNRLPHQDARLTWSRNGILDRHRQYVGVAL